MQKLVEKKKIHEERKAFQKPKTAINSGKTAL